MSPTIQRHTAIGCYKDVIALFEQHGFDYNKAAIYQSLASTYAEEEMFADAVYFYTKELDSLPEDKYVARAISCNLIANNMLGSIGAGQSIYTQDDALTQYKAGIECIAEYKKAFDDWSRRNKTSALEEEMEKYEDMVNAAYDLQFAISDLYQKLGNDAESKKAAKAASKLEDERPEEEVFFLAFCDFDTNRFFKRGYRLTMIRTPASPTMRPSLSPLMNESAL